MTPREIEPTRIEFIVVGDRLRSVPEDKARALAKSMDEIGLQTPITVRVVDGMVVNGEELVSALVLVAGATRLRAAQILEWEYIDCFEIEDDELHARLWEVDENLMRAELSPAEEAGHLTERKRVWQEIEKAEKEAADLSDPTWATLSGSTNSGGRGHTGFATDTAEATSKSKTSINRAVTRGENVAPEVLANMTGTKLDTGTYLDTLGKLSEDQQRKKVDRDLEDLKEQRVVNDSDTTRARQKTNKDAAFADLAEILTEDLSPQQYDRVLELLPMVGAKSLAKKLSDWMPPSGTNK